MKILEQIVLTPVKAGLIFFFIALVVKQIKLFLENLIALIFFYPAVRHLVQIELEIKKYATLPVVDFTNMFTSTFYAQRSQ